MDNINTLKQICKFMHITKYSGLKKNEINLLIDKHSSVLKIQRWIRKILSKNRNCPISLEPIKYPCFAFKSNNVLIYYNLLAIKDFLIKTGDFRDPISRISFTDAQLMCIDEIDKATNKSATKSVYKASKNKKYYEKIKEKEFELLTFERILDEICTDMIAFVYENINNNIMILNSIYLFDYRIQFKRLLSRSITHAEYTINKNIDNINHACVKESNFNIKQIRTCEYVILFLYQLREELYVK